MKLLNETSLELNISLNDVTLGDILLKTGRTSQYREML